MDIFMNKFYLFFLFSLFDRFLEIFLDLFYYNLWELLYIILVKIRRYFSILIYYDNILLNFGLLIFRYYII